MSLSLLNQKRLYLFFLLERLVRELNVLLLSYVCLSSTYLNGILARKRDNIFLQQKQNERKIELIIFHLRRMASRRGLLMDEEAASPYRIYKREPISAQEYRKKDGLRARNLVRLQPFEDPTFKGPLEEYKEEMTLNERREMEWRNEAKIHFGGYGSYDRVSKVLVRTATSGLLIIHKQSDVLKRILRDSFGEERWHYWTNEDLKTRCSITKSNLKRTKKIIRKRNGISPRNPESIWSWSC